MDTRCCVMWSALLYPNDIVEGSLVSRFALSTSFRNNLVGEDSRSISLRGHNLTVLKSANHGALSQW